MVWASGTSLFADIIEAIGNSLTNDQKYIVYEKLIIAFENRDCDNLHECIGLDPVLDELLDCEDDSC